MYKEVLRSIEGIGIFPSISLILFLGFFIGLIIYLVKKGKSHFEDVSRLPLESDDSIDNH
ncbi:MAG: cbb3-type cytochrome oxidase subunit 3 [Candidatus Halalkalibacterium sp. M3_1C_030]|mgnify:CR=1 FL=1